MNSKKSIVKKIEALEDALENDIPKEHVLVCLSVKRGVPIAVLEAAVTEAKKKEAVEIKISGGCLDFVKDLTRLERLHLLKKELEEDLKLLNEKIEDNSEKKQSPSLKNMIEAKKAIKMLKDELENSDD